MGTEIFALGLALQDENKLLRALNAELLEALREALKYADSDWGFRCNLDGQQDKFNALLKRLE